MNANGVTEGDDIKDGNDAREGDGVTDKDRRNAQKCLECPMCRRARRKQKGLVFWFVKKIEGSICPQCKAYEKVYGRKAHEPVPSE